MNATDTAPGPVFSAEAYAAVEKAAKSLHSLYVPSVLEHAAELLTTLWAAGEQHGSPPPSGVGGQPARRRTRRRRQPVRAADDGTHPTETFTLARHLLEALTSDEIGLSATLGPRANVVIERSSATPRGGFRGDANLIVGIYTDGGWDMAFNQNGASVLRIVAPASQAGACEVAEIVRALVRGELGNPSAADGTAETGPAPPEEPL
ncbi:hypothetical protein NKH77_55845 [Streptomyces sp. M19]